MKTQMIPRIKTEVVKFISAIILISVIFAPGQMPAQAQNPPSPVIWVEQWDNKIIAKNWSVGAYVDLTIIDPYYQQDPIWKDTQISFLEDPNDPENTSTIFELPFELDDGAKITVGDLNTIENWTLPTLEVESFEQDAPDFIIGNGPIDSELTVSIFCDVPEPKSECYIRKVPTDSNGKWWVDYGNSGSNPGEEETVDLKKGMSGLLTWYDENGNRVRNDWHYGPEYINVVLNMNKVIGGRWALGNKVYIEIDDPATNAPVDYSGYNYPELPAYDPSFTRVRFDPSQELTIEPGMNVTLFNDEITKQHRVLWVQITDVVFNEEDKVYGRATPFSKLFVYAEQVDGTEAYRQVYADEQGNWMVDFGNPQPGYSDVIDLEPGSFISAFRFDGDNDRTSAIWTVTKGSIIVDLRRNRVRGRNWALDVPVTIYIDDPETQQPVDYTDTQVPVASTWNPDLTIVDFYPVDELTITPGMKITLTDGQAFKQYIVLEVEITNVDSDADLVYGRADPLAGEVGVYAERLDGTWDNRFVTPYNELGDWTADYGNVGPDDMTIVDLDPGTYISAVQFDLDGDRTNFEWTIPYPGMDQDLDYLPDLTDPCPADPANQCNPFGSAAALIDSRGGTLTTPNQAFTMVVPENALSDPLSLTITDGGSGYQLSTNVGEAFVVLSADIGPDGTTFNTPITVTLQWQDVNSDGIVDGLDIQEADLWLFKDGIAIAGPCSSAPGCDQSANTFNVSVSSLSHFALGMPSSPTIASLEAPIDPLPLGTSVTATAVLSGAGSDSYLARWDWGDGTSTTQSVLSSNLSASHIYAEPGVYEITLTLNYGQGETSASFRYVVIYDPIGGFVTGGGWINSLAGWCQLTDACTGASGKASFGFVSKYNKGANVPSGSTEFQFIAGNLNFHSASYDWLVVNKSSQQAQFKGAGSINGNYAPNGQLYKFMIWAANGSPDTFRIKIWYELDGSEVVVYDNGAAVAIGGGNIAIHK